MLSQARIRGIKAIIDAFPSYTNRSLADMAGVSTYIIKQLRRGDHPLSHTIGEHHEQRRT